MGIRVTCPNGHKLHVKEFLADKRGICPNCGAKFIIPAAAAPPASASTRAAQPGTRSAAATDFSSASMIISVVEPSRAPLAPRSGTESSVPPQPVVASPVESSDPVLPVSGSDSGMPVNSGTGAPISDPTGGPVAPAVKYVARRIRSRRNQTTMAICLLIAVIVLAVILIVVLRQNTTSAVSGPAGNAVSTSEKSIARAFLRGERASG